jgi:hypothetical protein
VFLVKVCNGLLCMFKVLNAFSRVAAWSVALPLDQVKDPVQITPVVLRVEDFLHLKLKVAVNFYGVGLRELPVRLINSCACEPVGMEYIV